ncbi:hypothetical protein FF38_03982 [Lucilia cuprina]|uniref:Uncharacterized protein n=1 Tax=Lucilia cuprina TaxID=7375 RepID=A0A0L0BNW7_LUCCU|nr:hypothetical protein FF38_03982 [Lucilia cuprina]
MARLTLALVGLAATSLESVSDSIMRPLRTVARLPTPTPIGLLVWETIWFLVFREGLCSIKAVLVVGPSSLRGVFGGLPFFLDSSELRIRLVFLIKLPLRPVDRVRSDGVRLLGLLLDPRDLFLFARLLADFQLLITVFICDSNRALNRKVIEYI